MSGAGLYGVAPSGVVRLHSDGRTTGIARADAIRKWSAHLSRADQLAREAEGLARRADLQRQIAAELEAALLASTQLQGA